MSNATTRTAGQDFAAAARRYFSVGPRTRRYRAGLDMHAEVIEAARFAATMPGYFGERTETALRVAYGAALGYQKHIAGYRASVTVVATINAMTPWQFIGLLAEMVDAGVSNTGEGEEFFRSMARKAA
jgi:hypothetical protein